MGKSKDLSYQAFMKRIKDTIKLYDMLKPGERVLVAVSGGADSVCLLHSLHSIGLDLVVANLDHKLRGLESERDSRFVKNLAKELGLKYVHKRVDVMSKGKKGTSVEEKAREIRYGFLVNAAKDNNCDVIATGHTLDDQAETVLMRIIYGSSIAGITGIYPVRNEGNVRIIRPLLRTDKKDILSYLKKNGYEYVDDSSNSDTKFLRNKVRLDVIPYLENLNPRIKRSLVNLSDSIRDDYVFINSEKKKAVKNRGRSDSIKIKDMILQPKAIRKEVFKELLKNSGGNIKRLTHRHWMDMDCFLRTAEKNKSLDFPGDIRVTRTKDELRFRKRGV